MGLAPKSVDKAREILTEMIHIQANNRLFADYNYEGPESTGSFPVIEYSKENHLTHHRTSAIMVCGEKSTPGAWENVFINLEGIDSGLLDYFYDRKSEVPNTHFINFDDFKEHGIVSIGFF